MKTKLILGATLALNVGLAAMFFVPRGKPAPPAPRPSAAGSPTNSSAAPLTTTNVTTPVIPFHWRQVESEDYRRYIANLRALGCPERLIHDIILADIKKLYEARERDMGEVALEPWVSADRQVTERFNHQTRQNALREEQRTLVRELIGGEWSGSSDRDWEDWELHDMLLGYLPEGIPSQLMALVEHYSSTGMLIRSEARGILLDEDFAKLATLHIGMTNEMAALLSPADWEELRIRAQILTMLSGREVSLEGVELSGAELREVMRASLAMGDIFRSLFPEDQDSDDRETKQREAEFEQKVAQILGPERFADYQLGKDEDYHEAFKFAREKKLTQPVARMVGRAMAAAREALAEIKRDKALTPEEREAAISVLAAVTRNNVAAALGSATAAEYLKENGGFLPGLDETPKKSGRKR